MRLSKRNRRNHYPTFNNLLEGLLSTDYTPTHHRKNVPAVNIIENEDTFNIEVALPGISKKDVNIDIDDNLLTISREVKEEKTEESKETETIKYTRKEFSFKSFKRTFSLPDTIDADSISASAKDGILVITLPKKEEAKVVKRTIKIS